MKTIYINTGYTITSSKFDSTAIENPFYETSSINGTLIDEMKNNIIVVKETELESVELNSTNKQPDSEKELETVHNNV